MTIGILGGGALGQLMAHKLHHVQQDVCILTRPGQPSYQADYCLESADTPKCVSLLTQGSDRPLNLSAVLVLTKAYQSIGALTSLLKWLPEDTPIFLLHNGMGPQFEAVERWPTHLWWAGSLTDGALKLDKRTIRHTGQGRRLAGPLNTEQNSKQSELPEALTRIGFEYCHPITTALWQKLTVNLVINPLTAANQVENGALLGPEYQYQVDTLCQEISLVGHAEGHIESWQSVKDRVLTVAKATASNRSSMLQDVMAKRRTELDAITGYLLSRAEYHHIATTQHQALYQALSHTAK